MKRSFVFILIFLLFYACTSKIDSTPDGGTCLSGWQVHSSNPVIKFSDGIENMIWNDPSVIKEDGIYKMWLSGGKGVNLNLVKTYYATSTDGIDWSINTTPIIEPDPDITITGTLNPDVTGHYTLISEDTLYNFKPAYKWDGGEWYIWYDATSGIEAYVLSDNYGPGGTKGWKADEALYPNGTYSTQIGGTTGDITSNYSWDSKGVETPTVVKVDDVYHMYYTGYNYNGSSTARFNIGHATSADGITWIKDPANPILEYHADVNNWGFYSVAEPGVILNTINDKIYLYYATTKIRDGYYCNDADHAAELCNKNLNFISGICLATSNKNDGSNFTLHDTDANTFCDAVHIPSTTTYSTDNDYRGFSTPSAYLEPDETFHLLYDLAIYPSTGDEADEWVQTSLSRAISTDGITFTETESNYLIRGNQAWNQKEIRAPVIIREENTLKMWFAGNNSSWLSPSDSGIGYATYYLSCD